MAKKCPLIGKKCIEHQCEFYVHLVGKNPQSEQAIDQFACAISWLPLLLVENAQVTRHVSASVEKARNVFFKALPDNIQGRIQAEDHTMIGKP